MWEMRGRCQIFIGYRDLRTLLFAGRQGLANSTFSHVSGLPDLFMEHDVGAIQGQENQLLSMERQKPITISFEETRTQE
jgi:hypothetical protein